MKIEKALQIFESTPEYQFAKPQGMACRACSKDFPNLHMLGKHAQSRHNAPEICNYCWCPIPHNYHPKQHKSAMHPTCKACKKNFDSPFTYYWHMKLLHFEESRDKPYTSLKVYGKGFWRCSLCSYIFYNLHAVHAHERAMHRSRYNLNNDDFD